MILKQSVKPVLTLIIKLFGLLPIQKNKILFSAFSARDYSDNPKYVAEELLHENLNVDCVFVLNHKRTKDIPSSIRVVKYNTLRYLYELATSKIWVDNTRKQDFIVKRREQIYIQTWHGALPFKKIEKDVENILTSKYIKTAKNDSSMINYLLTDSSLGKKILEKSFWFNGKILTTGSPRLDVLFKDNLKLKEEIRQKMSLDSKTKYILYAPTFRDDGEIDVYNIDFNRIVSDVSNKFGGKWKIILRLHPNIRTKNLNLNEDVINASMYPDIMELFLISEVLITDYSSTMFDFALTGKSVFLYVPDAQKYLNMRSSYFKLKDLPFSTSSNMNELEKSILRFNDNAYSYNLKNFFNSIDLLEDGHASARVASLIKENIDM